MVSRFYKINLNIQEYDAEAEDSWFLDVGDFIENQDKIMASLIFLDNPDFTKAVKRWESIGAILDDPIALYSEEYAHLELHPNDFYNHVVFSPGKPYILNEYKNGVYDIIGYHFSLKNGVTTCTAAFSRYKGNNKELLIRHIIEVPYPTLFADNEHRFYGTQYEYYELFIMMEEKYFKLCNDILFKMMLDKPEILTDS